MSRLTIMRFGWLLFWFVVFGKPGIAQNEQFSTKDKTAIRFFYLAYESYQSRQLPKALKEIEKAIEKDPLFIEALVLKGDIQAENKQSEDAIRSYLRAIQVSNPVNPRLYLILAQLQLTSGYYAESTLNIKRYLEYPGIPDQNRKRATNLLEQSLFGERQVANPVPFAPVNMGDSVNSKDDEFINGITADGEKLYFTRWIPEFTSANTEYEEYNEDFFFSLKKDSVWTKAGNLGKPINTEGNEGAMSIAPDGNSLFFAACNREDGFGSCDIYQSKKTASGWSQPQNLGEQVNSPQWDSQPTFSSDGKTLYFASKRAGGKGSSDIWKAERFPDGSWSRPVNLGDSVNTTAEEMAPYIHPDNQTLYFSSNGHPGMGGLDFFISRKKGAGWTSPKNLGYPINTSADESTLIVDARGSVAFFSTDKLGGFGRQDVYRFSVYPAIRPVQTTYFKGIVYDEVTGVKLEADFELTDLNQQSVVAESKSNRYTGEFLLVLPVDRNYALNVAHPGYLFYSDNFMLSGVGTKDRPIVKNIPLKPIKVGEEVVLRNIFFDTDLFTLKEQSMVELNKLLLLMNQNPSLKIEIGGHTDNIGSEQHNLELSDKRAKAVYDFLTSQGINAGRMSYRGYGFRKPIDTNQTEEGRANNRRTEFRVVGH